MSRRKVCVLKRRKKHNSEQEFLIKKSWLLLICSMCLQLFHLKNIGNGPTETALDSLKIDVTKTIMSEELKHMSPSCKKHWKDDLMVLQ